MKKRLNCVWIGLLSSSVLFSQEPAAFDSKAHSPGHSMHDQSFNEGPRQAGYLMEGMGNTRFIVSTQDAMAQRFFDQGIAQLHGFWYFESERSFRQAAAFDPEHPMHYWGMARANIENLERSWGFIEQAKAKIERANEKEKRLIDAWHKRVQPLDADKADGSTNAPKEPETKAAKRARLRNNEKRRQQLQERLKNYAADLEQIAYDYPEDIELKAMIVLQAWQNEGAGIPVQSHVALDSILSEIFRSNPRHPAHHFRIHLWDYRKEKLAVQAAAQCGPSAPGIAHMWHMPGHTYNRLQRYQDAAWQQEASARVDHAHMMRDRVMPDQIHNYAHNNEWLIRSLNLIGKVGQATSVAKNMIELPQHPDYNQLRETGSASYGRERLIQTLTQYEQWQTLLSLLDSAYLGETGIEILDDERLAWGAISAVQLQMPEREAGDYQKLTEIRTTLQADIRSTSTTLRDARDQDEKAKPNETPSRPPKLAMPFELSEDLFGDENDPALEKPMPKEWREPNDSKWDDERKKLERHLHESQYRLQRVGYWLHAIEAYRAAKNGDFREALRRSHEARPVIPSLVRIQWLSLAGEKEKAFEKLLRRTQDGPNELVPLAHAVWVGSQMETKKEQTKSLLEQLAPLAFFADKGLPILERLEIVVDQLELRAKWSEQPQPPADIGERPRLETLGPLQWQPSMTPLWYGLDAEGRPVQSKQFAGKPILMVLYLGFGCLHCAEQLGKLSPEVDAFQKMGIEVIGLSSETPLQLREGLRNYKKEMRIPLFSNAELDTFRAFRAFDDFEGQPLHGTFLIDANGRVRWQDIDYEPFMDIDFLKKESARLLAIPIH